MLITTCTMPPPVGYATVASPSQLTIGAVCRCTTEPLSNAVRVVASYDRHVHISHGPLVLWSRFRGRLEAPLLPRLRH